MRPSEPRVRGPLDLDVEPGVNMKNHCQISLFVNFCALCGILFLNACSTSKRNPQAKIHKADAISDVEYIAQTVANGIEGLKNNYPQLKPFSASQHLEKCTVQIGIEPGNPGNEELYSVSFSNGILGRKPTPNDGMKRSSEDIFDPELGVRIYVHFFVGEIRGNDSRPSKKIGNLSVHLYVSGPASAPIKADIQKILDELKDEYN